ncbi:unnamed protein product [Parascedosporium putredinis]|uniref:Uncharacterized protein n=1 Tax=Parascedosporium putredinis TaxID=1442378 RepID=A0A9P1GUQ0_9PEZI|nr:unnamed protein product [Parascedosporium putredinis]CAI7987425.1 unnamed protein product [Parascedosporium putredinis]
MRFQIISVLTAASLVAALTPQGFQPGSQNQLFVQYGNQAALNGAVVLRDSTQVQPTLATTQRLQGTYAVLMIDLDIPTDTPGQTNTLLHWLQTGLTSSAQATSFNTTGGTATTGQVFLLQNRQATAPLAEVGFNAQSILTQAGLASRVVAGNFFNVTNPGPVGSGGGNNNNNNNNNNGGGTNDGQANPTDGTQVNPTGSNTFTQPAASGDVQAAGLLSVPRVGAASLCIAVASVLLWAL